MFKPCSKGCQHTLRILAFVFAEPKQKYFRASDACAQVGVPEAFTRKILQSLVRNGLLKTRRGPGGGYAVVGDPGDLSFLDVIKSVDGENAFEGCILGTPDHSEENHCPFHDSWVKVRAGLVDYLASTNLTNDQRAAPKRSAPAKRRKKPPRGK